MLGIHSVYTDIDHGDKKMYDMLQFEVYTMVLSCLNWRKYHGPIKLYCDDDFLKYIKHLGLLWLWDEIDTETLKNLPNNINYGVFWAYPKLYINSLQTEPFASLDIDLYVDGPHKDIDCDILFCNLEKCDNDKTYPPYHLISPYDDKLTFKDFNDYSSNVALLVVNNLDFYKEYISVVNEFVINNDLKPLEGAHRASLITFIEQRLLFGMIKSYDIPYVSQTDGVYNTEYDLGWSEGYNTNGLTHLWGWKYQYRDKQYKRERLNLTQELKEEIINNFGETWESVRQIENLVSK